MPRAFLSYSRRDFAFAEAVAAGLAGIGAVDTWFDAADLGMGADWEIEIAAALRRCDLLLLVASPEALRSPYVRAEWSVARRAGMPVLLAVVGTWRVRVPAELRDCPVYDLRIRFREGVRSISDAITAAELAPRPVSCAARTSSAARTPSAGVALAPRRLGALRGAGAPSARVAGVGLPPGPRMPAPVALVEGVLAAAAVGLATAAAMTVLRPARPEDAGRPGAGSAGPAGGIWSDPALLDPALVRRVLVVVVLAVTALTAGALAVATARRSVGPTSLVLGIGWPWVLTVSPLGEGVPRPHGVGPGRDAVLGTGASWDLARAGQVGWALASLLAVVLVARSGRVRLWLPAGCGRRPSGAGPPGSPGRRPADPTGPVRAPRPAGRSAPPAATGRPDHFDVVCAPADEGIAALIRAACRAEGLAPGPGSDQRTWTFVLITPSVDWTAMDAVLRGSPATTVCVLGASLRFARATNTLSRSQWIDLREQRPAALQGFFAQRAGVRPTGVGAHVPPSRYDALRLPRPADRATRTAQVSAAASAGCALAALLAAPNAVAMGTGVAGPAVGGLLFAVLARGTATRRTSRNRSLATAAAACLVTAAWCGGAVELLTPGRPGARSGCLLFLLVALVPPVLLVGDLRYLWRFWLPREPPRRSRLLTPVPAGFPVFRVPLVGVTVLCLAYSAVAAIPG